MDGVSYVQMNMAALGGVGFTPPQSGPGRSSPALDGAATALGMSSSDLRTALQGGQSLSSIASSKGVSQDTLVAAMASSIEQANPNISADQATKIATAIATRTPPAGGTQPPASSGQTQGTTGTTGTTSTQGHHHHHGHHAVSAAMDAAAQLLGTTSSDLETSLQGGQSLASIASSKGISQNDLVSAMATALQSANSNLTADQANQLATTLATRTSSSNGAQPWSTAASGTSNTFSVTA